VLSYTSSLRFIIVTPMVLELSALGFFTIGHACNSFQSPKAGLPSLLHLDLQIVKTKRGLGLYRTHANSPRIVLLF
jgi:hypothetical protein